MSEKIYDRIEIEVNRQNTNINQLAKKSGVSNMTFHNMKSKGTQPIPTSVDKIAKALDVSADWLQTGQGEPGTYQGANSGPNALEGSKVISEDVWNKFQKQLDYLQEQNSKLMEHLFKLTGPDLGKLLAPEFATVPFKMQAA